MQLRRATVADVEAVVQTITDAFHHDPTWSFAFPDPLARPGQYRSWWRLFVDGAMPHDETWVADDCAAVAVWIPPGCSELSKEQEAQVEPLLRTLLGAHAEVVLAGLAEFDEARPREPHHYLTLLATRTDRRGEGLGMALLRHCLDRVDAAGGAAYLESTNPDNDRRYESVGFVRTGSFIMPGAGPTVATMWRPARA